MRKSVFATLVMAMVPFGAFAVDGVTLINISTVKTQGGFPYPISVAGSYKLSGNLVVPVGLDGINITVSNVTLDLNGFSITSTGVTGSRLVFTTGLVRGVTVRNGTISSGNGKQIDTPDAIGTVIEDVTLVSVGLGGAVILGRSVIVRRVSAPDNVIQVTCPALVVDSLAAEFSRNTMLSTACIFGSISGPVI